MDCTDIHDCDSSTYCFALDIYKNLFSEIWHHEKINIIKKLRVAVSTDINDPIESKRKRHFQTDRIRSVSDCRWECPIDPELTFSKLMDWELEQVVMSANASASDDLARAVHLKAEFGNRKAAQITPLMVNNFRVKMKKTKSERNRQAVFGVIHQ
jgi:hypothetical protein